ncbi:unnamed protein product, partial [Adineta steineri]
MTNSPVPIRRQSQTEILTESTNIRTSTPIFNTLISEKFDLPNSLKVNEALNNSTTS